MSRNIINKTIEPWGCDLSVIFSRQILGYSLAVHYRTNAAPKVLVGDPWPGCITDTERPLLFGLPKLGLRLPEDSKPPDLR